MLAAGACSKAKSSGAGPASSAVAEAPPVEDFPSTDAKAWVNGAPRPLAAARGDVVLVEVWHRL